MRKKFIVYWHDTIADHRIINAHSPAEAKYIMEQRFKTGNYNEPVVDKVMSEKEEAAIVEGRDNPTSWN